MKVYIKNHAFGAGKWIYKGYANAWESLGHQVEYYDKLLDIKDEDYYLMVIDGDISGCRLKAMNAAGYRHDITESPYKMKFYDDNIDPDRLDVLSRAKKVFLFVQPFYFLEPWGSHTNFITSISQTGINEINSLNNIVKWTFVDTKMYDFYQAWGDDINNIHLAFDSIEYKPNEDSKYKFDISYVGTWANNGYDEKKRIMTSHFVEIKNSGLKAGVFVNQNISIQDEANLLYNSKVSINIHDRYQHVLGSDINERTFKSLGLNGFLISDKVEIMKSIFPNVPLAETPQEMIQIIKKYCDQDLTEIKKQNRNMILENHTYINRVEQMLSI
jgi:spore maturation protein CgeB